jgi:hypothetical protein
VEIAGMDYPTGKELSEALKGKQHTNYWMACCPAHEDETASLSIREKDGRILVHCHAGCTQESVLGALRDRGMWPKPNGKANGVHYARRIDATYDYVDEVGEFQFQVVRYKPKDFRQRRRPRPGDPRDKVRGGWVWSVDGAHVVPYRLPEALEAIANGAPVFIVEGEKDADNLTKLGIVATCNAGGAGNWRPEHAAHLKGANSGWMRAGARVIRTDGDGKKRQARRFSTWAAKVIATIRAVADTLMDRGVIILLRRKAKYERVERFRMRCDGKHAGGPTIVWDCCVRLIQRSPTLCRTGRPTTGGRYLPSPMQPVAVGLSGPEPQRSRYLASPTMMTEPSNY